MFIGPSSEMLHRLRHSLLRWVASGWVLSQFSLLAQIRFVFFPNFALLLANSLSACLCPVSMEKARLIDPFGHSGLTPLGEIRMTLAGEIKMTPVEASAGKFFEL